MTVVQECVLNFADIINNNNKFYNLQLLDGGGVYEVKALYGRVGANNPSVWRSGGTSLSEAQKIYNKKFNEKTKKGYVAIGIQGKTTDTSIVTKPTVNKVDDTVAVATKSKVKVDAKTKLVYDMLADFMKHSRSYVKHNIKLPLGGLTPNQIAQAYDNLDKIQQILDKINGGANVNNLSPQERKEIQDKLKQKQRELVQLSNDFYRSFPIEFNKKGGGGEHLIIDTVYKLGDLRSTVDIARSVVKTQDFDNVTQVYESLGLDIKPLSKTTKEYKERLDYVLKSQSHKHNFKINVTNIYSVQNDGWDSQFNPDDKYVKLLFHGSRTENFLNILQTGLKIKPPGAVHAGSMFGNGVYFADQSSKSANYCWGFSRSNRTNKHYMLICSVAVGKVKELEYADSSLVRAPRGYDSVLGKKGRSLLHNEFIVYNENQAKIRYIVEFNAQ